MKYSSYIKKNSTVSSKQNKSKGFVLLYSMLLSSMLLTIALGVLNVSLKEINFSTSGKETNDAFFAADTGAECALYYDRPDINRFLPPASDPGTPIICPSVVPTSSGNSNTWSYLFNATGLGSDGDGCAIITISKDDTGPILETTVTSRGYNKGGSSCVQDANSIERQIQLSY